MKLKYETPYIVELELDNRKHLIAHKSDGINIDVGYLPGSSIDIHVRDKEEDHGKRYK